MTEPGICHEGWLPPLLDDLRQSGGSDLHQFLRAFGPETSKGRRDLPALVDVYTSPLSDSPTDATRSCAEHLEPAPAASFIHPTKTLLFPVRS